MDSLSNSVQDEPFISVIVPVYNVKEYVGSCLDSILAQTYTKLEVVLVDDGSTDGSVEVCDAYAEKDARIRVIRQAHKGVSEARNRGLHEAQGEYITFVDSDDLIKKDYLQTLYGLLTKYKADIAVCLFEKRKMEEDMPDLSSERAGRELCLDSERLLKCWHGKYKKYETSPCCKLYHRNVFGQGENILAYPSGRHHEDVLLSHRIVQNADKIALTDKVLYIYRRRKGSITNSGVTQAYIAQNLRAQRERMQFFREKKYYRSYLNLWKGYMLHRIWFAVKKRTSG